MRLTTWNCCQRTDLRVPVMLEKLAPDVAVVPESAQTPRVAAASLHERGIPHAWTGKHRPRGLGIYVPAAEHLEVIPPVNVSDARHGLAVRVALEARTVTVLGLWTVPHPTGRGGSPYMRAVEGILEYDHLLEAGAAVVAGDFNVSAQSNPDAFPELLSTIEERYGLRSAYHTVHGVAPGDEADMTLWWRRNRAAGFHCDLILFPDSWQAASVTVGAYEDWGIGDTSSDHAPVSADLVEPK